MDLVQGSFFEFDSVDSNNKQPTSEGSSEVRVDPLFQTVRWFDSQFIRESYGSRDGDSPEREGHFLFRTAVLPNGHNISPGTDPASLARGQYLARVGAILEYNSNLLVIGGGEESGLEGSVSVAQRAQFKTLVIVCLREIISMVEKASTGKLHGPGFRNLIENGYVDINSKDVARLQEILEELDIQGSIISDELRVPDPDRFSTSRNRLDVPPAVSGVLRVQYGVFVDRLFILIPKIFI